MNPIRPRTFRAALALLAGALPITTCVFGQAAPAPAPTSSSNPDPQKLEAFVVTGSYIPSAESAVEAGISPVVRVDRKDIEESGSTNTAELLQRITVANANS